MGFLWVLAYVSPSWFSHHFLRSFLRLASLRKITVKSVFDPLDFLGQQLISMQLLILDIQSSNHTFQSRCISNHCILHCHCWCYRRGTSFLLPQWNAAPSQWVSVWPALTSVYWCKSLSSLAEWFVISGRQWFLAFLAYASISISSPSKAPSIFTYISHITHFTLSHSFQ